MKRYIFLFMLSCFINLRAQESIDYNVYRNDRFFKELYYIVKPTVKEIKNSLINLPHTILHEWLPEHPHENQDALVRFADFDELCKAEKQFTNQRLARIKKGLQNLLHVDLPWHSIPRIAVCCSGGGHRAMLLTFGFLKGLQDIGVLDCVLYMSGLSGSTWAMAPWVASGQSLDNYITTLSYKLNSGLEAVKHPKLLHTLGQRLITKAVNGQFLSMIDIMGPTLANTLLTDFGHDRLHVTLSESHAYIVDGHLPLPIYTSVTPNIEPYEWVEFTPFEVGSSYLKAYVPTWAYGRKFKYGRSVNFAAEQSLGYLMGIFGSAFGIDVEDAVRHTSEKIEAFANKLPTGIQKALYKIIDGLVNSPLDDVRLAPSSLPNFVYKTTTRPLNKDKTLTLIDAGIHFNLPFPPLLREERKVDIILTCDASGSIIGCKNLHWAEEYMKAKGIPFPPIDYDRADKQVMTIFQDETDPSCPIVIYFPRIKNEAYSATFDPETCQKDGYCKTMNFTYNEQQIDELMGLSAFAVNQHADSIIKIIQEVAAQKTS